MNGGREDVLGQIDSAVFCKRVRLLYGTKTTMSFRRSGFCGYYSYLRDIFTYGKKVNYQLTILGIIYYSV